MSFSRIAVAATAAFFVSVVAPSLYAQTRIAVVNFDRVVLETEDGQAAQRRWNRIVRRREKAVKAKMGEVQEMFEEYRRQESVLTDEAKQQKQKAIQEAMEELNKLQMEAQQDLQRQWGSIFGPIQERVQGIIRRIAQREGYSTILNSAGNAVLWYPTNLDLTDMVIQAYNREHGGGGMSSMGSSMMSSGMGSSMSSKMR